MSMFDQLKSGPVVKFEKLRPNQINPGDVFGRLTARWETKVEKGRTWRWCRCTCGKEGWFAETRLRSSQNVSCGCAFKEKFGIEKKI